MSKLLVFYIFLIVFDYKEDDTKKDASEFFRFALSTIIIQCLETFTCNVICGHSLVGSNSWGPPVFQALSPYQISSQYL